MSGRHSFHELTKNQTPEHRRLVQRKVAKLREDLKNHKRINGGRVMKYDIIVVGGGIGGGYRCYADERGSEQVGAAAGGGTGLRGD